MVALCFFPFPCWVEFCSGCFRQVFVHLGDKTKWSLVALDRWSCYTVTIVRDFVWVDSTLVVLDEWSSYRGGHLNSFSKERQSEILDCYFYQRHTPNTKKSDICCWVFEKILRKSPCLKCLSCNFKKAGFPGAF